MATDIDALFGSEDRFVKFKGKVLPKIGAALGTATAAPPATENISEAKKFSEDIGEVLENRGIESLGDVVYARVSKSVVHRAFLAVDEHRVGFGHLFEFFFSRRAVRIAVGMILHGELAIRALDFLLARGTHDTQHLVIIAFDVGGDGSDPSVVLSDY